MAQKIESSEQQVLEEESMRKIVLDRQIANEDPINAVHIPKRKCGWAKSQSK